MDMWVYTYSAEFRKLEPVCLVIKKVGCGWFGHVEHKNSADLVRHCIEMKAGGTRQRASEEDSIDW